MESKHCKGVMKLNVKV